MTKPVLVINDVHLGVNRQGGTTPQSQQNLKKYLQDSLRSFVFQHLDKDLIINGDLFDGFTVDISDVLDCYFTLANWLSTMNNGRKLILVAGNHDIGKRNDRMSSFSFLANLLDDRFPNRVTVVDTGLASFGNIHVIPHCMNQDLFDIELEKALKVEPGYLLLHANVDNGFAENSDHSLNVNNDWLIRLSKLHVLVFAHEHQGRVLHRDGHQIIVCGNQWPSSVSDCMAHGDGQKDGLKRATVIHPGAGVSSIETWDALGDFEQMDWTDLHDTKAQFIRVTGKAGAESAASVISAIAKYRQSSNALVITNAVAIDGVAGMDEDVALSFEGVKSFDVLGALLEQLSEGEAKVVKELLEC